MTFVSKFGTHKLTSDATTATTLKTLVNPPIVANTGLTPVTIGTNGALTVVEETNANWYYYVDTSIAGRAYTSHWANAKTSDDSLWVWLPRYAYKLTYYTTAEKNVVSNTKTLYGVIDVVFLSGTTNNDFNGNDVTSATYVDAKGKVGAYIVHPSFQNGNTDGKNNGFANGEWDKEISGFWMAKFEAGYAGTANTPSSATDSTVTLTTIYSYSSNCTYANYTSNYYGTRAVGDKIKYPVFKASRPSMNYLGINDVYNLCLNLNATNNPYGFTSIVSPHLTKNSEWGAVTYLTHSKYGRNGEAIRLNNVSANGTSTILAVTGYGGTSNGAQTDTSRNLGTLMSSNQAGSWTTEQGQFASCTRNTYGIYDLSGGTSEWTAGYIATTTANDNYNTYGGSLKGNSTKYKTKYAGTSATSTENYALNAKIGDSIWETSLSGSGTNAWATNYSEFLNSTRFATIRGGAYMHGNGAGTFFFYGSNYCNYSNGFRPVVIAE